MADYKEVRGTKIRDYTTNPDNPIEGQVWYNETDNVAKYEIPNVTSAGTWATGNNLNTARRNSGAVGTGTQALCISGDDDPPVIANVEQWNGGSWTEIADVNTARRGLRAVGD